MSKYIDSLDNSSLWLSGIVGLAILAISAVHIVLTWPNVPQDVLVLFFLLLAVAIVAFVIAFIKRKRTRR